MQVCLIIKGSDPFIYPFIFIQAGAWEPEEFANGQLMSTTLCYFFVLKWENEINRRFVGN
jgi:hypothetical protein